MSLLPTKAAAFLTTLFGAVGLVLAAVGLYGVLSYTVSQRIREIGIRMALGAPRRTIRSLVLEQGTRLVVVGVGLGFALVIAGMRVLKGLLFGVSPTDPMTFGGIAVLLIGMAALASSIRAFRATRTNPVDAPRHE